MPVFNEQNITLDRYAIGEIVDLVGMPDFYNAGSSKWLRSAIFTSQANLTADMKLAFQSNANPSNLIALNSDAALDTAGCFHSKLPIPRISGSSVSAVPGNGTSTLVQIGAITSAGLQLIYTGQTASFAGSSNGTNVSVASDNTSLWALAPTGGNSFSMYKSTDAITWANQSLSGLPTFSMTTPPAWPGGSTVANTPLGDLLRTGAAEKFTLLYCGARYLILASGGTNYIATRSSNGTSWGGDESTSVLGSATVSHGAAAMYFYRNGNNCWLSLDNGPTNRYTTDGGVNWNTCTNAPTLTTAMYIKRNTTTPAKIAAFTTGALKTSADSGATWTTQTLPATASTIGGAAYIGSVLIFVSAGVVWRSGDDGATWAISPMPANSAGLPSSVFGDATQFYLIFAVGTASQLMTSTNGTTWTIRNLNFVVPAVNFQGIASYNSNSVLIMSDNTTALFTNNGGVTWSYGALDTISRSTGNYGDVYTTPDGGGYAIFGNGTVAAASQNVIALTDVTNGGSFYRTGATAVTPIRANALSYMRVA